MNDYLSYAAIIYVTEIEKRAVMSMYDWENLHVEGDDQPYQEAYIEKTERNAASYVHSKMKWV